MTKAYIRFRDGKEFVFIGKIEQIPKGYKFTRPDGVRIEVYREMIAELMVEGSANDGIKPLVEIR
jgi:hypothetical protein